MNLETYIESGNARIHAIDSGPRGDGLPFIYIPGIAGTAKEGEFLLDEFTDRRCIALSMRGRGKSSTPPEHYSIADHGADLANIIAKLGVNTAGFHLHGYSISVMYALAFLTTTKTRPATLILGDHPAKVDKLPENWAHNFAKISINGHLVTEKIRLNALQSIESCSSAVSFIDDLERQKHKLPVLLLRGGSEGFIPSLVSDEDETIYRRVFQRIEIMQFKDAGHFFRETDRVSYLEAVGKFIRKYDV